jgi:hypothetical protein
MRAQLVDLASKRVLAAQEWTEIEAAASDDAAGGAAAADRALARMLRSLADFCVAGSAARGDATRP